ncbi:MAG: hypothetical protein AB7O24_30365 [Kofleriaceae bacterium]
MSYVALAMCVLATGCWSGRSEATSDASPKLPDAAASEFPAVKVPGHGCTIGVRADAAVDAPVDAATPVPVVTDEAVFLLDQLANRAKAYYAEHGTYPQGLASVLPGAAGAACFQANGMLPVVSWTGDLVWSALGFSIGVQSRFSYSYTSSQSNSASILAVGDLDCDASMITYALALSAPDGVATSFVTGPAPGAD